MPILAEQSVSAFRTASPLHLVTLGICVAICVGFALAAQRACRKSENEEGSRILLHLQQLIGWGCLVAWVVNTAYWLFFVPFRWEQNLPLQFCNLANLIGAGAVLRGSRLLKAVLYFWATTLCIWAFLTPVLDSGPNKPGFWIFWIYHLFIPLAVLETILVQRFRPGIQDLRSAWIFTVIFGMILAIINFQMEWNYGFVGPSTPSVPTLIDVLGPYPLRLLWMLLIGSALFIVAWLPWIRRKDPAIVS